MRLLTTTQRQVLADRRREKARIAEKARRVARSQDRVPDSRAVGQALLRVTLPAALRDGRRLQWLVDELASEGYCPHQSRDVVDALLDRFRTIQC